MRALRAFLLILVVLVLMPSPVWATDYATISFGACQPSVTTGRGPITIDASGTYTKDASATLKSVTLYAVLSNGGPGAEGDCGLSKNTWACGTPLTISCLSSGSYTVNVYARIYVTVCGADYYYDTTVYTTMVTI